MPHTAESEGGFNVTLLCALEQTNYCAELRLFPALKSCEWLPNHWSLQASSSRQPGLLYALA
jgi:hypothetical protein